MALSCYSHIDIFSLPLKHVVWVSAYIVHQMTCSMVFGIPPPVHEARASNAGHCKVFEAADLFGTQFCIGKRGPLSEFEQGRQALVCVLLFGE